MRVDAEWDAEEYRFGQLARLSISVTNDTGDPILVGGTVVDFRRTDRRYSHGHSVSIGPGESRAVQEIRLRMSLWAERAGATGSLTVAYKRKRGPEWSGQLSETFPLGRALTVTDAEPTGRRIFISHSNRDRDRRVVEEAARIVRKAGFEPYVSEKSPRLGDDLWEKIRKEVMVCDGMLLLLTEDGARSCDMREELGYARMRNAIKGGGEARIVPIVEEGIEPAGSLKGKEYEVIDVGRPRVAAARIAGAVINSFVDPPGAAAGRRGATAVAQGEDQEPPGGDPP